ncbi:MAG: caspase family protein [Deltaproteobacteria bacterium]|nr:caspase family protein [Deltaproteobacteria bacterium]
MELICIQQGESPEARSARMPDGSWRCALNENLAFAVLPIGNARHVALFGIDEAGQILWYTPTPTQAASHLLQPSDRPMPIERTVRLDVNHRPGDYRVWALFSNEALRFDRVQKMAQTVAEGGEFACWNKQAVFVAACHGSRAMKSLPLWVLMALTLSAAQVTAEPSALHVLIVANNMDPDGELAPLRYADDDGVRYAELFEAAGARVELLTTLDADSQKVFPGLASRTRPPTRERFRAAIKHLFDDIRHDNKEGRRTELVFIYTGHGRLKNGQGQMMLTDGVLDREALFKELVEASPADENLLILDACHAYFLVLPRGDWQDDAGTARDQDALRAFLRGPNRLDRHPNTGVILSTAGAAEVHEWSRIRGGVFSHELRSALLGLGDVNGDRRVDYAEVEAFLAAANAGITNPKAQIQVFIQPPAQDRLRPILDLTGEDARGLAYATWNKAADHDSSLALLFTPVRDRPNYYVRQANQEAKIALAQPGVKRLELAWATLTLKPPRTADRGSVAESFRSELFSVPFGRAFSQGYAASRSDPQTRLSATPRRIPISTHQLSLGYLLSDAVMEADGLAHGMQLAYRWRLGEALLLAARFGWTHADARREGDSSMEALGLDLGVGAAYTLWEGVDLWALALVGNRFLLQNESTPNPGEHDKFTSDLFAPALGTELGVRIQLLDPLGLELAGGLDLIFGSIDGTETRLLVPSGRAALLLSF